MTGQSGRFVLASIFMFAAFALDNVGTQELRHFNKSSGVDFETDNVYAEIVAVAKQAKTTDAVAMATGVTDPDTKTTASFDISANKKETKSQTASWEEPVAAKVIGDPKAGGQGLAEVTPETSGGDSSSSSTGEGSTTREEKGKQSIKMAGLWDIDSDDLRENTPPYITFPISNKRTVLIQHKDSAIHCEAVANPAPEYKWYKNGILIENTQYVKAFPNGTLSFTGYSSRDDDGSYHCTAKNAFGLALSVRVPIVGELKPTGDRSNASSALSKTVKKWQKVTLVCGKVPPTIPTFVHKWYDDESSEIRTDDRVGIDSNGNLVFAYTELKDSKKVYRCGLAPPSSGWAARIEFYNPRSLTVEDSTDPGETAPSKQQVTTNGKAILGSSFVFECFFSGRPVPSISWKNSSNHNIRMGDPRYEIFDFNRKLRVKVVRQEDEGEFKCTATNSFASQEVALRLNVTTPPLRTPGGSLGTYTKPDKTDFTLTCRARVAEREQMDMPVWFRNGQSLREVSFPDPARYHFNDDHTELTIERMDKTVDTASYQCSISNSEGNLFMNGYLRVINSIEVTRRPPDVIHVTSNDTGPYDITVLARGDSCCRINRLYYFNNTQLSDDTLRRPPFRKNETEGTFSFLPSSVTKATLESWVGTYRCRVSNPHQDVDVTFQINFNDDPVPVAAKKSTLGLWWIGLLCGVLLIIIAIIIIIIIYKSNYPGETYKLEKTELKHNLQPEQDLLDQSFQEI